jgi:F-type H+-transporting ATPase subunit b
MSELIHNLGIDWKVLIAQVVNFTILLLLLRKFAYGPILRVLRERREKIESAIERARTVDQKMAEIEQLKKKVLDEARTESATIIRSAEEASLRVKDDIVAKAHEDTARLVRDAERKIEAERQKMREELHDDIAEVVLAAVEKTAGEVLDKKSRMTMVERAVQLIKTTSSKV